MAGVLSSCGAWTVDHVISFLVVATGQLSDKVYEVIKTATKEGKYRFTIHKCESVFDVIRFKPELQVDIVVFAFDEKISRQVKEVENSIGLLDEFFIISGRVILVNCYGFPNTMGLTCHAANKLKDKYCLRLFSANIFTEEGQQNLGNNILKYSEAVMGINSGIPNLNMLAFL